MTRRDEDSSDARTPVVDEVSKRIIEQLQQDGRRGAGPARLRLPPPALFEAGLYCRADDRAEPVIQLAPPLVCTQDHFDEVEQLIRSVLAEAWTKL